MLPKAFQFLAQRMPSFSKNNIKVIPASNNTVSSGQQVNFRMPKGIVDLSSWTVWFKGSTSTTASYASFPRNIEGIIQRYIVNIGTASIVCNNWNDLLQNLVNASGSSLYLSKKNVYGNSADQPAPSANVSSTQYAITELPYTLTSSGTQPQCLDLSLLPDVEIVIQFAPSYVLCQTASTTGADYALTDIYGSLDIYSFNDMTFYNEMVQLKLSTEGSIDVPFKHYQVFQRTYMGSIPFYFASQSLDMVLFTSKPSNYSSSGVAVSNGQSNYFKFADRVDGSNYIDTLQMTINGTNTPAWALDSSTRAYVYTLNQLNAHDDLLKYSLMNYISSTGNPASTNLSAYQNNNYVVAWNVSANDPELISGIDTRGSAINMEIRSTAVGSVSNLCEVFCLATGVIKVYPGRLADVVF